MISIDTNILFAASHSAAPFHDAAAGFLKKWMGSDQMAVSEFVLAELYGLLRNQAVVKPPLSSEAASEICEAFRCHPSWQLLALPQDWRRMHDELWHHAASHQFKRTRIYDARLALSLIYQGVTEFATVNMRDFEGFGFNKVWNPLK